MFEKLCLFLVYNYTSAFVGITDPQKFRECLKILKRVISRRRDPNNNHAITLPTAGSDMVEGGTLETRPPVPADTLTRSNSQKLRDDSEPRSVKSQSNSSLEPVLCHCVAFDCG